MLMKEDGRSGWLEYWKVERLVTLCETRSPENVSST